MASSTRTIRRRIKSVRNTRKITKAMELVAGSKMRKAVQSVTGTRPFARLGWETVRAIAQVTDPSLHPLLKPSEGPRVLLVVFASDRGLAGAFNANLARKLATMVRESGREHIQAIAVGRRAGDALRRLGVPLLAAFTDLSNQPSFAQVVPIARLASEAFLSGATDRVDVLYTDFISAISQRVNVQTLLPLNIHEWKPAGGTYQFEPTPSDVLDRLLPRLVETALYQALLESAASEHSARMMAMRSASDNAKDMIEDLSLAYNQVRQAGITQEIAEISGGKAALET